MAVTIRIVEAQPETYPAVSGVTGDALAAAWQRVEAYVDHRWAARNVTFHVEGTGEWDSPLSPATFTKAEVWRDGDWVELTLPAAPLGGYLLAEHGPFRFTGTVGAGPVPAAVAMAVKRLAEYQGAKMGKPGARNERIGAGSINLSHSRHEAWLARAIQNSRAGDLLRPYRRPR